MQNLRIPGPTPCPPETLGELSRQMINHRGPEFAALQGRIMERLKSFFRTQNEVYVITASGTGALQTTSLPIDVATRFGDWYRSPDAAPHGGAFTITVPFTVQGDLAAVRSLSVTLNNGDGASPAMSANF